MTGSRTPFHQTEVGVGRKLLLGRSNRRNVEHRGALGTRRDGDLPSRQRGCWRSSPRNVKSPGEGTREWAGHIQKTVAGARWQIDYRDGQGRRHRASFDTRKEVDKRADGHQIANRKGRVRSFEASAKISRTRGRLVSIEGRSSARTACNWRAQIDLHLNWKLGDLRLRSDPRRAVRKAARRTPRRKLERQKRQRRVDDSARQSSVGGSA